MSPGDEMKIVLKALCLALCLGFLTAPPAQAGYIDPNTGGLLFQLLAALFALFSGVILFFSGRIKQALFRVRRFRREARAKDGAGSQKD